MEETSCRECNSPYGFAVFSPPFFTGEYGSIRYDMTTILPLGEPCNFIAGDRLCDECLDAMVASGKAEVIAENSLGGDDIIPSIPAIIRLFMLGARIARERCAQTAEDGARTSNASPEDILALRRYLCSDGFTPGVHAPFHPFSSPDIHRIGACHVAAAHLLGCCLSEEAMLDAARSYADALHIHGVERQKLIETLAGENGEPEQEPLSGKDGRMHPEWKSGVTGERNE